MTEDHKSQEKKRKAKVYRERRKQKLYDAKMNRMEEDEGVPHHYTDEGGRRYV